MHSSLYHSQNFSTFYFIRYHCTLRTYFEALTRFRDTREIRERDPRHRTFLALITRYFAIPRARENTFSALHFSTRFTNAKRHSAFRCTVYRKIYHRYAYSSLVEISRIKMILNSVIVRTFLQRPSDIIKISSTIPD